MLGAPNVIGRDVVSTDRPSALQALVLWALVARGGASPQASLRPEPDKKTRDALAKLGLINAAKRGRAVVIELTDGGWAWAAENMRAPLSTRSPAGGVVLTDVLARLEAFLATHDIPLAEFIHPAPRHKTHCESAVALNGYDTPPDLAARIRAAYFETTGGVAKRRVRLADLEGHLPGIARPVLHRTLLAMQADGGAGLLRQEDPTKLTEADHAAVLSVGGEPRHFLWLD